MHICKELIIGYSIGPCPFSSVPCSFTILVLHSILRVFIFREVEKTPVAVPDAATKIRAEGQVSEEINFGKNIPKNSSVFSRIVSGSFTLCYRVACVTQRGSKVPCKVSVNIVHRNDRGLTVNHTRCRTFVKRSRCRILRKRNRGVLSHTNIIIHVKLSIHPH